MTTLTTVQTLDMLGDLASGELDDVFSQEELQRFFDRAESDYNTAVYYGWLQIYAGKLSTWFDYQVAQTKISRKDALTLLERMVDRWASIATTGANQVAILGMTSIPTRHKPMPADETCGRRGYWRRGRWFPYG